jgi:hypothetical protein
VKNYPQYKLPLKVIAKQVRAVAETGALEDFDYAVF